MTTTSTTKCSHYVACPSLPKLRNELCLFVFFPKGERVVMEDGTESQSVGESLISELDSLPFNSLAHQRVKQTKPKNE